MRMQDYFSRYDSLSSEEEGFKVPFRKEYLLKQIGHGKKVLDVGCLGGQVSELIARRHNEVWGVEINPVAAEAARKKGVRVVEANVEDGLPFEDRSFDVVNAGEVLENLFDTKQFFLECRRVLRHQGLLILTTPNLNSFENRLRVIQGHYLANVGAYPEDQFGKHVRIFNIAKVRELCVQSGFEIEDVRGVFRMSEPPSTRLHGGALRLASRLASRLLPQYSRLLLVTARKLDGIA